MSTAVQVTCHVCGAKNDSNLERCASCGARLDSGVGSLTPEEIAERDQQQDPFSWKWVLVALVIYLPLTAIFIGALPMAIDAYDPQGLPGLGIIIGTWFIGGIAVGAISPGRTFLEPTVAAALAAVPSLWYLSTISDVQELNAMANFAGGSCGVMLTLLGSFLGEKLQGERRA